MAHCVVRCRAQNSDAIRELRILQAGAQQTVTHNEGSLRAASLRFEHRVELGSLAECQNGAS